MIMAKNNGTPNNEEAKVKKKCGIIMPIAPSPEYPPEHWKDVLSILIEAVEETDFEPRLVSDDVAIGLIHDRIVTNIYHDDIIVCDVSSKNPNVMFELGLRLAFDKPTIIIKDEKTGYSFDTGVIEHISYPSSLRFSQIVDFKIELAKRIKATYDKSQTEPNFSPFLKSFGKTIVPSSIQQTEVPEGKYIMEQLDMLRHEVRSLRTDKSNDYNYKRKAFSISANAKRQILHEILSKVENLNQHISNEEDFYNILRKEALNNGFNISLIELKEFMDEYLNERKNGKK